MDESSLLDYMSSVNRPHNGIGVLINWAGKEANTYRGTKTKIAKYGEYSK